MAWARANRTRVDSDSREQAAVASRLLRDMRYRYLASDTYIATLSLVSVGCAADDARVLETARERDSRRGQPLAISHSSASSSACVNLSCCCIHEHLQQLVSPNLSFIYSTKSTILHIILPNAINFLRFTRYDLIEGIVVSSWCNFRKLNESLRYLPWFSIS